MRIKLFGHYWHVGLGLVWLAESLVAFGSCWAVVSMGEAQSEGSVRWTQSLVFGGCVMLAMISMGLFSRRLRDRMAGVVLRITLSTGAGAVLATLVLALWPWLHLSPRQVLT